MSCSRGSAGLGEGQAAASLRLPWLLGLAPKVHGAFGSYRTTGMSVSDLPIGEAED